VVAGKPHRILVATAGAAVAFVLPCVRTEVPLGPALAIGAFVVVRVAAPAGPGPLV
jgi:hypothetical protein